MVDATFQMIAIERGGETVNKIYIAHINKNYVRKADLDIGEMMSFSLVTEQVRSLEGDIRSEIETALLFLAKPEIDETNCCCLKLTRRHHCDTDTICLKKCSGLHSS